jgi:hypothetical protein
MFGYFVRRVDKRFQLERSLGLLEGDTSDAVQRLERLFAQVGSAGVAADDSADGLIGNTAVLGEAAVPGMLVMQAFGALCALSAQTAEIDVAADPDKADSYSPVDPDTAEPPPPEDQDSKSQPKKGVLRDYIESFDQQTLADTARCGAAAVACRLYIRAIPQSCCQTMCLPRTSAGFQATDVGLSVFAG